jgi:hypothetical protein
MKLEEAAPMLVSDGLKCKSVAHFGIVDDTFFAKKNIIYTSIRTGFTRQISSAYCVMVRSLENFPLLAVFRIDFFVHSVGFFQRVFTRSCASIYDA